MPRSATRRVPCTLLPLFLPVAAAAIGCRAMVATAPESTARPQSCGNGVLDRFEDCDDGNTQNGDGCAADCANSESGFLCPEDGGPCLNVALCGNGVLDPGEACDDGNTDSADGCMATCEAVETDFVCPTPNIPCASADVCGNGVLESLEACDDGNVRAGDGCTGGCVLEADYVCPIPGRPCLYADACGNGSQEGAEACDDGNNASGDGCRADCSVVEQGYACPQGGSPCVVRDVCGNGLVDPGEACDDLNVQDEDGCAGDCTRVESDYACPLPGELCVPINVCGNGLLENGEACDDGNEIPSDGCAEDCTHVEAGHVCMLPGALCVEEDACGNGILENDEVCDDGNNQDLDGCNATCTATETGYVCSENHPSCVEAGVCGNGILDPFEVCDDGNTRTGDGCLADCSEVTPGFVCPTAGELCVLLDVCGNGLLEGYEVCDDGNQASGDGCAANCLAVETGFVCPDGGTSCVVEDVCGNGLVDAGEACDDGNAWSGDGCAYDCSSVEADYTCPPAGGSCQADCGNGEINGEEACDDGNNQSLDGCRSDCTAIETGYACPLAGQACISLCGNAVLNQPPEECDRGTAGNTGGYDGCNPDCTFASYCGDGSRDTPHEACDLGVDLNTGAIGGCKADCTLAPACNDNALNGNETGIDCGGPDCPAACPSDEGCEEASDCASLVCGPLGICSEPPCTCQAPTCSDGVHNGTETYVDCGGNCVVSSGKTCPNDASCLEPSDCASGVCTDDVCQEAICSDHVQNGDETDIDCGGSCVVTDAKPCQLGEGCDDGADCASGHCEDWICQSASCVPPNGLHDGDETDVDCGGVGCPSCTDDKHCEFPSDCTSGVCTDTVCQPPVCGDGITNGTEECDDKDLIDTNNCRNNCRLPFCGDDVVSTAATGELYEECDDGINDGSYATCMPDCTPAPFCGDGHVDEPFEECDDTVNDGSYDTCRNNCRFAPYCGDSKVETPPEACDDGNTYGSDGCSADCTSVGSGWFCPVPGADCLLSCGNGRFDAGEACDDGGKCLNGDPCLVGGEPCADASTCAARPDDGCSVNCTIEDGYACPRFGQPCRLVCGNGVLDENEICDDGGMCDDNNTRCTVDAECQLIDESYTCTTRSEDGCQDDCLLVEDTWECPVVGAPCNKICGNNRIDPGEQCDFGGLNADGQYNGCNLNCTLGPRCGDNAVDAPHEECDDGFAANSGQYGGCRSDCTWSLHCGDGVLVPPETCEDGGLCDGDASECANDPVCQASNPEWRCMGDGGDGCDATCQVEPGSICRVVGEPCDLLSDCGNGIIDGTEACDDGGLCDDDVTPCTDDVFCQLQDPSWSCTPRSGDGCDETCSTVTPGWFCPDPGERCSALACGDGVQAGVERCDDGNTTSGDGCSASCQLETGKVCVAAEGNGICELGECTRYPTDCTGCSGDCGDGTCGGGEDCTGCPSDCGPCELCHDTTCGNGILEGEEQCDDFDTTGGDGCSSACTIEAGHVCFGMRNVLCGVDENDDNCACDTTTVECGNGVIEGGETCDDGKHCGDVAHTSCTADAQCESLLASCKSRCGNLVCEKGECTSCPSDCPSQCEGDCGDDSCDSGAGETAGNCPSDCGSMHCGDKDLTPCTNDDVCTARNEVDYPCTTRAGDGCGPLCSVEPLFECFPRGTASYCRPICGDSKTLVAVGEECDDGNLISGDGCSAACTIEPGSTCTDMSGLPDKIKIEMTFRDFRHEDVSVPSGNGICGDDPSEDGYPDLDSGDCFGHPDFQAYGCGYETTGLVLGTLSADGKPQYNPAGENNGRRGTGGCGFEQDRNQLTSEAWFNQWYRTTPNVNREHIGTLELSLSVASERKYEFDSYPFSDEDDNDGGFFPLDHCDDGAFCDDDEHTCGTQPGGCIREGYGISSSDRNFHFTSEFHTYFQYNGGERLIFVGDDDVWVFINNTLAVDLGGLHPARTGVLTLSNAVDESLRIKTDPAYGLYEKGVYEIAFFHAERHTHQSNFKLTLSGFLRADKSECDGVCGDNIVRGSEHCDDGGTCSDDTTACSVLTAEEDCGASLPCTPRDDNGCSATCKFMTTCGDSMIQWPEACDPPDVGSGNTCDGSCAFMQCGDGDLDGQEECDGGTFCADSDGTICSDHSQCGGAMCAPCTASDSANPCRFPACGNRVVDLGEECDNGSSNADTGLCTTACTSAVCGDGFVQPAVGEVCDDGPDNGTYGHCALGCLAMGAHCGDGIVNGPEICDDGVNNGAYGTCKSGCMEVANVCGDGDWDPSYEECDAGDDNTLDGDPPGRCTLDCLSTAQCGDGFADPFLGEQCDNGDLNSDGAYDGCKTNCQWGPRCGDGVVNGTEICDDGTNMGAYGGCMAGCVALAGYCGDAEKNGSEECDNANNNGSYGSCNPDCTWAAHCGDSWVDAGYEQCDLGTDGNTGGYGTCNDDCTLPDYCGDGEVNGPEVCDDGVNDGTYNTCNDGCLSEPERCGDTVVQEHHGEECDDGINNATYDGCRSNCRWAPSCGDGVIQSSHDLEQCDSDLLGGRTCTDLDGDGITGETGDFDGGTLACNNVTCQLNTSGCYRCGDHEKNGFEECDDPDLDGMTCTLLGLPEQTGLGCLPNCTYDLSGCGQATTCPDGNLDPGETCDGESFQPNVDCDDLNGNGVKDPDDFDGGELECSSSCTLDTSKCYRCGDGTLDPTELCDGSDTGTATCVSVDPDTYKGGTLACNDTCNGYDFSGCWLCSSCYDCAGQACMDHQCGDCISDGDCCAPLVCMGGTCVIDEDDQ